jgi:hypothetical protein
MADGSFTGEVGVGKTVLVGDGSGVAVLTLVGVAVFVSVTVLVGVGNGTDELQANKLVIKNRVKVTRVYLETDMDVMFDSLSQE